MSQVPHSSAKAGQELLSTMECTLRTFSFSEILREGEHGGGVQGPEGMNDAYSAEQRVKRHVSDERLCFRRHQDSYCTMRNISSTYHDDRFQVRRICRRWGGNFHQWV